ncbi:MAG TPA: lysophospholipid acyltransferase family protein, partial [Actinomycetota bacterium]|nr:lysophospholipid acyltransferase family protein [Actinomycetota bacterium]
ESTVKMMETCRHHLNSDISVLIFPEGTRSESAALRPFKDGAFRLAMDTGRPVVPVALTGTGATLPKRGLIVRDRMDAYVQVLEPVDPLDFDSVESMREAVRAAIGAAIAPTHRPLDKAV